MKKFSLLFLFSLLVVFTGCGNKDKDKSDVGYMGVEEETFVDSKLVTFNMNLDDADLVSYDSLTEFFTPDYSVMLPDNPSAIRGKKKFTASGDEKTESVIPGLRKLSAYKTKYSPERKEIPVVHIEETEELTDNGEDFVIQDWGPSLITAENENPTFYVIFSQPVKSLTALSEPSAVSDIMTISPKLKGVFRWYGSRHLSFEAEEPSDPSVEYTISIKKDLKSLSGKTLTGETTFVTQSQPISIYALYGGYIKESDSSYGWNTGAKPPYENRFLIRVNYPITVETLCKEMEVKLNGKKLNYTAEADYTNKAYYWNYTPISNADKKISNTFIVTITDSVAHNSTVEAVMKTSKSSSSYSTLKPFKLDYLPSYASHTRGDKSFPISISFTLQPDKKTIADNISFDFDYTLTEKNFSINGTSLELYNLPVDFDSEYKIYIKNGLKDIYGQNISNTNGEYTFKTPPVEAYARFLDNGVRMMEAQFPHKLLFEYQNPEPGGYYNVRNVKNPIYNSWRYDPFDASYDDQNSKPIPEGERNKRQFVEVDLDPYLKKGFGFIKFQAAVPIKYIPYWSDTPEISTRTNVLEVQVTDLGVTARLGINKAVVMVRSLSTGKPVADASVYITRNLSSEDNNVNPISEAFASGKTNENGLCVIRYTEEQIIAYESNDSEVYWDTPTVTVVSGEDKAVFVPNTHNYWRDNVDTAYMSTARKPTQRTFMFVDRGVYRPGETVTFRGIDKDQLLGVLTKHTGKYKINIKGYWWGAKDIVDQINGELSSSGGFYGSFKLPDDLEPGTYSIAYTRLDKEKNNRKYEISFTVANFERVKFEANITVPDFTYYGGDKLSASVTADYLAGGALSNASYETSWFRQRSDFSSSAIEAKGYTFGPYNTYGYRNYYASENGTLSVEGTASLSCKTEKILDGSPYIYRVETAVTDASNQRISAENAITVHPALFYFGIKRGGNGGYPKKGEKIDFNYLLVGTDGEVLSEGGVKDKVKDLKYTLTREYWTMVNEQSVDNGVYTRYERVTKVEASGSITNASNGKFTITPPEAGWYTLKVTGSDSKDNYVQTDYEFYVTGGKSFWYDSNDSNSINMTPDQSQYNPGDTAQLLVESPLPEGDYLITVEREGIFTEEIRHFDSPANVIEIPIAANYVPVVYVSISSYSMRNGAPVHKYGEVDLDKPKGYFGVATLFINPYVRAFAVKVETDKQVYRPGDEVTLTLTATKAGKPVSGAELTVMAVDRGVLDLINYHVPNPIDYFYNRNNFPLRVKGGDSRDLLMDPVTYSIKDLQGGDAENSEKEDERKDFRPTALFEPEALTDEDGKVVIKFKMPDSLTTYRITAFGVKDDLFALQEDEVQVQNPVNVQQVQPRKLRVRDTAECGVLITNLDNTGLDVTIEAEVRIPTKNTPQDELEGRKTIPGKAFIDGDSKHKVHVAPGQSSVVYFDVAAEEEGTVELVYNVSSAVLNEKLVSAIKIEKTYVYETVTVIGSTKDNKKASASEKFAIPGWAKDGRGDLSLTLDATRLGMLGSSVNYLFGYPYGCLEQQSSRVLPLVIFGDYIDVFGLDSEVQDVRTVVKYYTANWAKIQLSNGGFPYWSGNTYGNSFVSARIAHIYAMGLKNGYTPEELAININSLKSYLTSCVSYYRDLMRKYPLNSYYKFEYEYLRSYISYVMGLLGDNRCESWLGDMYDSRNSASLISNAYLALALKFTASEENHKKAETIAKEIRAYLQPAERSVTILPKVYKDRNWVETWYANDTDTMAGILELFVTVNPKDEMVDRLLYTLLQNQSHGYWKSTNTTARVLQSIYTYIKQRNLDSVDYTATATIKNNKVMTEGFKGAGSKPKTLKLPFEGKELKSLPRDTEIPVTFEKEGTGTLYYTMEMKYALPDEMQSERDEGLKVIYTIKDYDTDAVINSDNGKDSTLILESGKMYKATVRVESTRARSYVALRAPIPSGAEILDSTFVTTGSAGETYSTRWLSNKYIMDNEIQFFWDDFYSGAATVDFVFRATRRGVYPVPPVQAECMYEPEIFGRSNGYLVQIK